MSFQIASLNLDAFNAITEVKQYLEMFRWLLSTKRKKTRLHVTSLYIMHFGDGAG